jgi:hypothetical protein
MCFDDLASGYRTRGGPPEPYARIGLVRICAGEREVTRVPTAKAIGGALVGAFFDPSRTGARSLLEAKCGHFSLAGQL